MIKCAILQSDSAAGLEQATNTFLEKRKVYDPKIINTFKATDGYGRRLYCLVVQYSNSPRGD